MLLCWSIITNECEVFLFRFSDTNLHYTCSIYKCNNFKSAIFSFYFHLGWLCSGDPNNFLPRLASCRHARVQSIWSCGAGQGAAGPERWWSHHCSGQVKIHDDSCRLGLQGSLKALIKHCISNKRERESKTLTLYLSKEYIFFFSHFIMNAK